MQLCAEIHFLALHSGSSAPAERNIKRTVAGMVWTDKTLLEWPEDDFRVFVGDLGNEVTAVGSHVVR